MNRNISINEDLSEFVDLLKKIESSDDLMSLFSEILTKTETDALSKRWSILRMLKDGVTQREISSKLNVSLCKVTRGAKILKDKNTVIYKYLVKDERNAK
jgi:TrpR family trp operon transcriptional repressor